MTLFKADRNFFIDLDIFKTARFEDTKDNEVIAHLLFKDGAAETLEGEAARNLHRQLGGLDESAQKATQAAPFEQEQVKAASAAPDLQVLEASGFQL